MGGYDLLTAVEGFCSGGRWGVGGSPYPIYASPCGVGGEDRVWR